MSDTQERNDQNEGEEETPRGDGRKAQKEYFKEELKRLQTSLQKEADKIEEPAQKEYCPYTFNNLKPYYDTNTARYIIELPEHMRHGYVSRNTAVGLCDPWVDHRMDNELLPKIGAKTPRSEDGGKKKKKGERPPKEGSTRLPKFPSIKVPAGELTSRTLYYSDVPMLREELRKKYTNNADGKVNEEYERTKADFYRMELDRMKDYHPLSRPNMRKAYFAYLQNNPGSKKAIYECVKTTEKDEDEEGEHKEESDNKSVRSSRRGSQASLQSQQSHRSQRSQKSQRSQAGVTA